MKRITAALVGFITLAACNEPTTAPAVEGEPVAGFADEWLYADTTDSLDSDLAMGVINIHETANGWAGWWIDSESASPLRQIRRTASTLTFTFLANGGIVSAQKQADGSWLDVLVFPGENPDPRPPGRLSVLSMPPPYAAKVASELVALPDGRRMHIHCEGTGAPVVLLDYGAGGTMKKDWGGVASAIAAKASTRVCLYDRAGRGLSDPGPMPRDAASVVADMDGMLAAAKLPPPYVLVGHSMGSYHVRLYANTHPEKTGGLVLVDPSGDGQLERFNAVIPKVQQMQEAMFKAQAELNCIGRLRETPVPPNDPLAQQCGGNDPDALEATKSEIEQMPGASTQQLVASRRAYGDMPLIVLTRTDYETDMPPDFTAEDRANMKKVWESLHAEMAALSNTSEHRFIPGAGHYIQRDNPQAVIDAAADVVSALRKPAQ